MPAKTPTVLRRSDDFTFDLSHGVNDCHGVVRRNGALVTMPKLNKCTDYAFVKGLLGNLGKFVWAHFPQGAMLYEHEKSNLLRPVVANYNTLADYCKYRDSFYLTYDNKAIYKAEEKQHTVLSDLSVITAIAFVNDRLVALQKGKKLYFSEAGDERITFTATDDKPESPSVTLPGDCQAIVSVKRNELYLLGEECYKMTVSADFTDVKLDCIASLDSKVSKRTVKVINDKVVFATAKRLYVLSGGKVKRIFADFDKAVDNDYSVCRASVVADKYVLSRPYGNVRRAYVLDLDKECCIGVLGDNVVEVTLFGDRGFVATTDEYLKEYVPLLGYDDGVYVRAQVDFGTTQRKFLRKLNIRSKYDVDVRITDENGSRTLLVRGSERLQSIPLTGSGVFFDYRILSRGQMRVDCFELVAHTYKEAYYGS